MFAATADLAALAGWVSHDCGRYAIAQRFWSYGTYAAGEAGRRDRGVEIVTRMSHQMIYLGHPQDALGLLGVAAKKATLPATRALVASQTGRVHAALGDEREADRYLGDADGLLADGLGDDVPEWVSYFDAAEHAGARAVSARDLAGLHRGRRVASGHFEDALKLRKPGSTACPADPAACCSRFFAAMAETERENIRESTLEGLDAAARKGKHGGRPPVITDDMLHTVLRRRATGESVEQIQPDLIIPTGKRKGQNPSVASIYRALAEHDKREAYPEAVEQAHADFAALQASEFPGPRAEPETVR